MAPEYLYDKMHELPFRPFRVRLTDKSVIDVLQPFSVVVGPTSAVMPLVYVDGGRGLKLVGRWKNVALNEIVDFRYIRYNNSRPKRRK